jgi:hypothetical protein
MTNSLCPGFFVYRVKGEEMITALDTVIMPSLWIAIAYWTVMAAYNSWGAKDAIMVALFILTATIMVMIWEYYWEKNPAVVFYGIKDLICLPYRKYYSDPGFNLYSGEDISTPTKR